MKDTATPLAEPSEAAYAVAAPTAPTGPATPRPVAAPEPKDQPQDPQDEKAARVALIQERLDGGIDLPIVFWIVAIHAGAMAAPFFFTWQAVVLTLFLGWLTGGIGVCLGYHRMLTHQSFKTYKPVRWLIAWIGGLAGEGSAVHWVANHRKHHALSDQPGDPHSPIDGPWWSHMLWFMPKVSSEAYVKYNQRWAPDLARDRVLVFLDRTFLMWHFLMAIALYGLGYWMGGNYMGWSFVIYGLFVRVVYVLHSTWLVNSATHMWGYRNYETTDQSTNLWWVAMLTYGEGWHNNHHAYPRMARHGHRWWEIDVTFATIRLMQKLGLAWDVVDYKHKHVERT